MLQPPFFMTKDVMAGVAQLEQFDEELYKVTARTLIVSNVDMVMWRFLSAKGYPPLKYRCLARGITRGPRIFVGSHFV